MSTGTDERGRSGSADGDARGRRGGPGRPSGREAEGGGDGKTSAAEREAAAVAQVVTRRAIRRLDMLEWVIFLAGVGLALLGGAGLAWILAGLAGWDFRTTWIVASILLFVVPGSIAIITIKREERRDALRLPATRDEDEDDG